jgi:hypothetical protein
VISGTRRKPTFRRVTSRSAHRTLFDTLMTTELLPKAERESANEKLRRHPRVSRNAGKLAAAVKVLLALEELDPDTGLAAVWS